MAELKHCNEPVVKAKSKTTGMITMKCEKCGRTGAGKTEPEAYADLVKETEGNVPALPSGASQLPRYIADHMDDMRALTVPFVANDKPALVRLIKNTVRYCVKAEHIKDCWKTLEGQESIVHGIEEALALGAELGKTGSLVPFGGVVEFIPAVEAFEFNLTNGIKPPFSWIQIDMIHKNDIAEISRVNGEFSCKIKQSFPRGPLLGVAVYGRNTRLDKVIGETYDVDRLLAKAKAHSTSYKYYLADKHAFEAARSEGELQIEGGREYIVKTIHKKGGGSWEKKLFADEITNPYEGADQPEMLRKAAGKSFLGKYARVRNSEAAIEESAGAPDVEKVIDDSIEAAFEVFETEADPVTEAEKEEILDEEPSQEEIDAELAAENAEASDLVDENGEPVLF